MPAPASSPLPASEAPVAPLTVGALALALAGVALVWLPVLLTGLLPALFALLIAYRATRGLADGLRRRHPALRHADGLALFAILALLGGAIALLADQALDVRVAFPHLLTRMASILEELRTRLPAVLGDHLPRSVEALRGASAHWLRGHGEAVQQWGVHALRGLGHVLIGCVIGAMMALQLPAPPPVAAPPLSARLREEFDELVLCLTTVVFAQARIAAINTLLTALFVFGVLPLLGYTLPMAGTLVALSFFAGLIPVLGNLVSNTVIVVFALSSAPLAAALALAWLVAIHKLEYFLNAHIIGTRIHARAWELLIAMLLCEALFGLGGLVSAPVIYAQVKRKLAARGWIGA